VTNDVVVVAFVAQIAQFAYLSTELSAVRSAAAATCAFCDGGWLARFRRNDTFSADHSAVATAVQFVHMVASIANHFFRRVIRLNRQDAKGTNRKLD
jgi:hypothetical protein